MSSITVCSVCGKTRMESNTVEIDGRTVCALCKPLFLQQLQEGVLPEDESAHPIEIPSTVLRLRDILLITWWILQDRWAAIFGLALLVAVPVELVVSLFRFDTMTLQDISRYVILYNLVQILVGSIGSVAIVRLVAAKISGRRLPFGQAIQHGFGCWLPAIWTGILAAFIQCCLYLCLIIPGIMWSVYYAFCLCGVSLKGLSGMQALGYSKGLVQGLWWHTALTLLGITILSMVPAWVSEIIVSFLPGASSTRFAIDVVTNVSFMGTTVCTTVLFLNLEKVNTYQRPIPSSTEEG